MSPSFLDRSLLRFHQCPNPNPIRVKPIDLSHLIRFVDSLSAEVASGMESPNTKPAASDGLGIATRTDVRQIAGYLTLLIAWVYEHFLFVRPPAHWGSTARTPLASRWNPSQDSRISREDTQLLRERLDDLHASEVAWDPYTAVRAQHPFHQISFFCGCLRSLDVIEPYHPHRVLRQFV
ncbi:hypothetical protein AAC387_Pa03g1069 [Persea americana]